MVHVPPPPPPDPVDVATDRYVYGLLDVAELEEELDRIFGLATGYLTHFAADDPFTMHFGKRYGCVLCFRPEDVEGIEIRGNRYEKEDS